MDALKKFNKDSRGVSSVLAEMLVAAIFVIVITSIFAVVTENDKPAESVHISAEEWVNSSSNIIYIRHAGGEPIDVKDLKLNAMINGITYYYSSSNISQSLGGKSVWELSDVIKINTIQAWGVSFSDENNVSTILVDTKLNIVLSEYRIHNKPSWVDGKLPSPDPFRARVAADFEANPQSGDAPLSVSFTDESSGSPILWKWDFGDNSSISTLRNPTHEFIDPGIYNVTLTGIEPGYSSTITKNITVTAPVAADFNAIPPGGDAPLSVNFIDISIGSPTSWQWNFGDGSSNSTLQNPTHEFTDPGIYNITLTAMRPGSNNSTVMKIITVNNPIVANFNASPQTGMAPLSVNFTDISAGGSTSWQWNFGDGSSNSTLQNPNHVFTDVGNYTVTLTAAKGSYNSTIMKNITVTAPVVADFNIVPASGIAPLSVSFTDTSAGGSTSWKWNFGDGSSNSTLQHPNHVFTNVGIYNVTLIATKNDYNSTKTKNITVTAPVVADFNIVPASGIAPLSVSFTDTSTGGSTSWQWNFGDGSSNSTLQNPSHTFTNPGSYTVTLTATKPGSVSTITKNIIITAPVVADFNAVPEGGEAPLSVSFTGNSSGSPTSWQWNFGDSSSNSTSQNPSHTFTNPGSYTVTLTATKPGSVSTITKNITANNFNITGETVVPNQKYYINATVIGSQISYGGQYNMKVTTQLYLDNIIYPLENYSSPAGSNVNDNQKHYWNITNKNNKNTNITVSGKAWVRRANGLNYNLDSSWVEWLEVSSSKNPGNIRVLKNGDSVPNKPGYLDQIPISTYLAPYTKNKKIVLGPYDAIFLFELGGTDTYSTSYDLNDLIVLVTLQPAS